MKLKALKLSMMMKRLSKEISYPVIGMDCRTLNSNLYRAVEKSRKNGPRAEFPSDGHAIHGDRSAEGHSEEAPEVNVEDDEAHEIYQQMIDRVYEETVQNL